MRVLPVMAVLVFAAPALAEELHPVGPLDGYACVRIAMPARKLNWNELPQAKAEPNQSAAAAGVVQGTMLARYPLVIQNGYAEIILFTGASAWIPQAMIAGRNARCHAVIMSDGKPGIG